MCGGATEEAGEAVECAVCVGGCGGIEGRGWSGGEGGFDFESLADVAERAQSINEWIGIAVCSGGGCRGSNSAKFVRGRGTAYATSGSDASASCPCACRGV